MINTCWTNEGLCVVLFEIDEHLFTVPLLQFYEGMEQGKAKRITAEAYAKDTIAWVRNNVDVRPSDELTIKKTIYELADVLCLDPMSLQDTEGRRYDRGDVSLLTDLNTLLTNLDQ